MFFAMMDTGGIKYSGMEYYAAGDTEEGARMAIATAFVNWTGNNDEDNIVGDEDGDWDETNVLEMLAVRFDIEGELTMQMLPEQLSDYYGMTVVELKPGQCVIQ